MRVHMWRSVAAASAVVFASVGAVAPAAVALPAMASVAGVAADVRDYWTPERMRAAVGASESEDVPVTPLGAEVDGQTTEADDELGAPWTGGGDVATTVGRLFFTLIDEEGGIEPSSCSANVVKSANESVIMTAHHCATGEDYLFVPAYHDGEMPFGGWTVDEIFTPEANQPSSDFAAFALDPVDGHTVEDVVGAQAISFDASEMDRLDLFGFPRERKNDPGRPYEGRELIHSSGGTRNGPMGLVGTATDMGRGVSGGPFFADFDAETGRGTQVAVVSGTPCLEYDEDGRCTEYELASYGALFNDVARALYEQASAV